MQKQFQKIIAREAIDSRRHTKQLILSGKVLENGRPVTELGSTADLLKEKIEGAGLTIKDEQRRSVYMLMHKPAEVVSSLADPEGRKNLRNLLRGFPERVYPVGNLEYAAMGLVFLTNDGDLAAKMLKQWDQIEQVYHVKIKGMLTLTDLERLGKEIGIKMQTLRQPDASRGHVANFWYEVRAKGAKLEKLRHLMFREHHPVEKVMRVGLGPLTVEGIPRGRYRLLDEREAEELKTGKVGEKKKRKRA